MRSSYVAAGLAAVLTGVLAGGCSGEGDTASSPAGCATPSPVDGSTRTDDLPVEAMGTVTKVVRDGPYLQAVSVVEGDIGSAQEEFDARIEELGWTVVGRENEVIEADTYFARGQARTGGAKFLGTGCEGLVRIRLFVQRAGG